MGPLTRRLVVVPVVMAVVMTGLMAVVMAVVTSYEIDNLDNGSLYEFKMKYQNNNGLGVYSLVRTAMPHKQADSVQTHIWTVGDGMITISAYKTPLNGLPLKH